MFTIPRTARYIVRQNFPMRRTYRRKVTRMSYAGLIIALETLRAGKLWRITISDGSTFMVEDMRSAQFFLSNIGWYVNGSIDSHGYMETCNKDW